MEITRRQLIAGLAAGAGIASAQTSPARGAGARLRPPVCVHSEQFQKVAYDDLGGFLRTMGFDGCIISFGPTGHVTPEHADLDLMRFVEAITGYELEVPALATPYTSPNNPTVRLAFAVGGEMGIPIFRPGDLKFGSTSQFELRPADGQRDLMGLLAMGNATHMTIALHNGAGASVQDMQAGIRGFDSRLVGYDFDIGYATANGTREEAAAALATALPRLKMVTARDCSWSKSSDGGRKLEECPLGEGMVDWPGFFAALVRARFTGPILLAVNYVPADELDPVRKDLAFLKKHLSAVYG